MEGRRDRARDDLNPLDARRKLIRLPEDCRAAQYVRMAAEIFGRGMDDHIRAKLKRTLDDWRTPRRIAHADRVYPMRDLGDGGNIRNLEQRIGWRLRPDEPR